MSDFWNVFVGLLIPLAGTVLGASMVFLIRNNINQNVNKFLLGFAAGVMIAASIWSLLIPAMEISENSGMGKLSFIPAATGFAVGIAFLLVLDTLIPHLHPGSTEPEGIHKGDKKKHSKKSMLFMAVTLHNIPEGMAVGVMYAGLVSGNTSITAASALVLSLGIAIQNFPEGAIISIPLKTDKGMSKGKAFLFGTFSGVVEPIAGLLSILLIKWASALLPYFLSFAAGAMIYVVVEELIPEAQSDKHSNLCTIGVAVGFLLMMILDVTLG
ncbi:MAG: ZIP family metal transporter [Bacilli bacterium]